MRLMHRLGAAFLAGALVALAGCASEPSPSRQTPPAAQQNGAAQNVAVERGTAEQDTAAGPTILVLGNSIAAGYGLDPEQSFPALLQGKIDSLGWDARVVNAGLSGETTAGGLRRLDWLLRQEVDVLVVELGGNDGLRGTPVEATRENLAQIIEQARAAQPGIRIVLAGMQIPPNLGAEYTRRFRQMYPALAEEKDVALVPFLLEGVGGIARLNQPDGIHPTAEGQQVVAENVWDVLRPVLEGVREAEAAPAG